MKTLILVLILLGATQANAVKAREARAWEYDKQSSDAVHTDFEFKIDAQASVVGGQLQIGGTLKNTTGDKKTAYVVSENDALKVEVLNMQKRASVAKSSKTPSMYALDIPAKSEVRFIGRQNLDELDYSGSPDVTLKWTFQFWTNPKPHGELKFKLPTLTEAKVNPLKLSIQKYVGASDGPVAAKLAVTLQNVSSDPQNVCAISPNVVLLSQDAKEITHDVVSPSPEKPTCFTLKKDESKELSGANVKRTGDTFSFESMSGVWPKLKRGEYMVQTTLNLESAPGATNTTVEATTAVSIP